MKLVSFLLLLLNLAAGSIAVSQNATFIAGQISQIPPCGVRQLIELANRRDGINSEYSCSV